MGMAIKIDYDKCCWKDGKCSSCSCKGECNGCLEVCPVDAITRKDKVIINENKCISCGVCVESCKHNALSLENGQ